MKIYEPFRSMFYAPQFVALHGGHFAAEGLNVQVETAGHGVTTTGALIDGHAEIALGGIMRSLDLAEFRHQLGARAEIHSRLNPWTHRCDSLRRSYG